MSKTSELTEGQRAYEARRAAKAGMTLEKWLHEKDRRARTEDASASLAASAASVLARRSFSWSHFSSVMPALAARRAS